MVLSVAVYTLGRRCRKSKLLFFEQLRIFFMESTRTHASLSLSSYSVFHRFRQAKFAYGGSILNPIQFLILHQLSLKMILAI